MGGNEVEVLKRRIGMRRFELLLLLSNIGLFALTVGLKKDVAEFQSSL